MIKNQTWIFELAFFVHILKHINELDIKLQDKNQLTPDIWSRIKSFDIENTTDVHSNVRIERSHECVDMMFVKNIKTLVRVVREKIQVRISVRPCDRVADIHI